MDADRDVELLRAQLIDIKDALHGIETDMRLSLDRFTEQFKEFSVVIGTVLVRLEERDKRFQEMVIDNRDTFARFGTEIANLKQQLHEVQMLTQKINYIERTLYGVATSVGGLFVWLIQKALDAQP